MNNPSAKAPAPPEAPPSLILNRLIFFFALLGILVVVHLWIQTGRGFDRGCFGFSNPADVDTVGCTAVVQSDAGTLFGLSNVVYGLLFFVTLAVLSLAQLWTAAAQTRSLHRLSTGIAVAGFLYALYLFFYQVVVLNEYCKLCLTSGAVTAVLFGLHLMAFRRKVWPAGPARTRERGVFAAALAACLMLAGADVAYFSQLAPPAQAEALPATPVAPPGTPEAAQTCGYADVEQGLTPIADISVFTDHLPYQGQAEASVRVVEFFDPNCPHCKSLHEYLQPFAEHYGPVARFYYQPYPIWQYSIPQVEALYLAAAEGKFFEMLDLQFAQQKAGEGLSIDELAALGAQVGMDAEALARDLRRGAQRGRVQEEHFKIRDLGFTGVPKLTVEGRYVKPSTLQACIESRLPS